MDLGLLQACIRSSRVCKDEMQAVCLAGLPNTSAEGGLRVGLRVCAAPHFYVKAGKHHRGAMPLCEA